MEKPIFSGYECSSFTWTTQGASTTSQDSRSPSSRPSGLLTLEPIERCRPLLAFGCCVSVVVEEYYFNITTHSACRYYCYRTVEYHTTLHHTLLTSKTTWHWTLDNHVDFDKTEQLLLLFLFACSQVHCSDAGTEDFLLHVFHETSSCLWVI